MKHLSILSAIKKGGRTMMIALSVLFAAIIFTGAAIWISSPGKAVPYLDHNGKPLEGSISEKTFVTIGGVRQGMFIKGKNLDNPVLLYLHGGLPDYHLTRRYPTGLEECFTVVWWDQRWSGLSFNTDIPAETINLDQLISDTKEVTRYLCNRFGKEKIYLMGRSGGTFIGIHTAASSPELYYAYIGVGQMSDHFRSERLAYDYMLNQYSLAGNRKMVKLLEDSPVTDKIPYGYLKLRDKAMHTLGIGTTRDMKSVVTGVFIPSLTLREYTLKEKINLWRGKARAGVHPLWETMITTDLTHELNIIAIPVYLFHGVHDYTVSYPLAKRYYEALNAPVKGFYTFNQSAHSPLFEEPGRVRRILISDVIQGRNSLADSPSGSK